MIVTKEVPGYGFLPYAYGSDLIDTVILNGTGIESLKGG
jgi:imidazolonepropionase